MDTPIKIYKKWKCYNWQDHGHYWQLGDATLSRSRDPGLLPGWFVHSAELDLDLQLTDSDDIVEYDLLDEAERVVNYPRLKARACEIQSHNFSEFYDRACSQLFDQKQRRNLRRRNFPAKHWYIGDSNSPDFEQSVDHKLIQSPSSPT